MAFNLMNGQALTLTNGLKKWNIHERVKKGIMIVYYDVMEKPDKDDKGKVKRIPFIKSSYVFNKVQLKSYDPEKEAKINPEPFD